MSDEDDEVLIDVPTPLFDHTGPCFACAGTGIDDRGDVCDVCGGHGVRPSDEW